MVAKTRIAVGGVGRSYSLTAKPILSGIRTVSVVDNNLTVATNNTKLHVTADDNNLTVKVLT